MKNDSNSMSKNDWTTLFVRVVGLYLVATHTATFAATTATLVITLTQAPDAKPFPASLYLWQGPVVSGLVLLIGLLLIFNAAAVAAIVQKNDKTR